LIEFNDVLCLSMTIAEGLILPIDTKIEVNANFIAIPSCPYFLSLLHNM
jgi:hypothetical protein